MQPGTMQEQVSIFAIKADLNAERKEVQFVEREQFIGLLINAEQFLLPMSVVSEIMMLPHITYLPQAPKYIEGVINLRGTILPAINLRKMLGMERSQPTLACRIIICRHLDVIFGILVDGITSVEALLPVEIEDNPMTGKLQGIDMLGRLSKKNEMVRGIFDIVKLLEIIGGEKLTSTEGEVAA